MSQWNPRRSDHSHRASGRTDGQRALASFWLRIVDLGLGGIIFVGPFLFGGRHMLGRFVILTLCILTASAWCARQFSLDRPRWTHTPCLGLLLTAVGWVTFQLAPLPENWLVRLAPAHGDVLTLWSRDASPVSLGTWASLSLSPEDTCLALATLIAYGLLFVTAVQRMETLHDVKRISRWIASSAIIVAAFGIVQYFTANGKYFWVYDHPYAHTVGQLKAGFTGRNHFAHFLVLGLANLVAWLMLCRVPACRNSIASQKTRGFVDRPAAVSRPGPLATLLTAASALLVFAILASLSRGGTLAMASALGVAAIAYTRFRLLNSTHLLTATVLVLVMIGALSFSGEYEKVARRLDSLTDGSVEKLDTDGGRRKIWSANIAALAASPLTGWGAGTHRLVYPLYLGEPSQREFTHAENGYLQIASEHGIPGILLLAAALGTCGSWCLRALTTPRENRELQIVAGGISAALAASVVHSIVDFPWFIPACMTVTILLAACAARLAQLSLQSTSRQTIRMDVTPVTRFNIALATALAGIWTITTLYPAAQTSLQWDAYLRSDQAIQVAGAIKSAAPQSVRSDVQESLELNSAVLLDNLATVVRDYPKSATAHTRLASALLGRFEDLQQASDNAMALSQIREAAEASQFKSPAALRDWLHQAFGDNSKLLYLARHHALQALRLCPLQGEAYVYLAELAFLEGRGPEAYDAYTNQALRVRPDNTDVLFAVGKNHYIHGDVDAALQLWARAYRGTGNHQFHIVQILAGHMTASDFLQVFRPDWRTLELLWSSFKQSGTLTDLQALLPYAAQCANQQADEYTPGRAGRIWYLLAQMQLEMNEPLEALENLQRSYVAYPESVETRRQLGKCLLMSEQFELAESHLRWCFQQRPDNKAIESELLQATRGRMQRLARTTYSSTH